MRPFFTLSEKPLHYSNSKLLKHTPDINVKKKKKSGSPPEHIYKAKSNLNTLTSFLLATVLATVLLIFLSALRTLAHIAVL